MTQDELLKLADRYQARADKALGNYQETGLQRYDRDRRNNEDLADALRMAANAADEHMSLISLRSDVSWLASRVQQEDEDVVSDLLSVARMHGLID